MNFTTQGLIVSCMVIMFVVFVIGGLTGYQIDADYKSNIPGGATVASATEFVGSGVLVMAQLATFNLVNEGMHIPYILCAAFDVVAIIAFIGVLFFLRSMIPLLGSP